MRQGFRAPAWRATALWLGSQQFNNAALIKQLVQLTLREAAAAFGRSLRSLCVS